MNKRDMINTLIAAEDAIEMEDLDKARDITQELLGLIHTAMLEEELSHNVVYLSGRLQ